MEHLNLNNKHLGQTTTVLHLFQDGKSPLFNEKGIRFGIATDSHYARKPPQNNQYFGDSLAKMEDFIEQMNLESVDFIIHLGDLKDEEGQKNELKTLGFLEEIESVFNKFSGNTYHCVGNHDLDSIRKHQFLNGICNSGIDKSSSYYSFDLNGFHFIVLDTNFDESGRDMFFGEGGNWQHSYVSEEELEWLRDDLNRTVGPVIVFCHHPLFKYTVSGKNYHIVNHAMVRQILEHSGKVKVVFQGHVHESNHEQINGIHYVTMDSMLESPGIKNNRYGLVEIGLHNMVIHQIGPAF